MSTLKFKVVPFTAIDNKGLNLIHVTGKKKPTKGPVLLVHGAGVRANIFNPPTEKNILEYLTEHGYDLWLLNWRGSIDLPPTQWTLDQVARYDHPAAVKKVVSLTGHKKIKAIIHCQGSTSFTMSAIAGLIPEVTTIVSNAVSLHTVVPASSQLAMQILLPPIGTLIDYIDPQWGRTTPKKVTEKLIKLFVRLTHRECNNLVCKMSSFAYGTGHPTLWKHENLDQLTHDEWINNEFGWVPLQFFRQMNRCLQKGNLVAYEKLEGMPDDYAKITPKTKARFSFIAGEQNVCFKAAGQEKSFHHFNGFRKNYHTLHIIPNYTHLDLFIGKKAHEETFPLILEELERGNKK